MAALATLLGFVVFLRAARHLAPPGVLVELGFVVVGAGWLGGKCGHVLLEARGHMLGDGRTAEGIWELLLLDPWHWARLLDPGHVFYAGVVVGVVAAVAFARRAGLPPLAGVLDAMIPAVAVGVVVGRLGCLLAGCCFGRPSTAPWAVHFAVGHPTGGVAVHPVQLYDAAVGVILLGVWLVARRRQTQPSDRVACIAAAYATLRATTETLRADADRGSIGPLSTSQAISFIVLLVAVAWFFGARRARVLAVDVGATEASAAETVEPPPARRTR